MASTLCQSNDINMTTMTNFTKTSTTQESLITPFGSFPEMIIDWYTKYNNGVMELHMHLMLNSFNVSTWTTTSNDGLWMAFFWMSGNFFDGILCKLNGTTDAINDRMICEDSYLNGTNYTIYTDTQNDVIYD
jgi:hypothetical protein